MLYVVVFVVHVCVVPHVVSYFVRAAGSRALAELLVLLVSEDGHSDTAGEASKSIGDVVDVLHILLRWRCCTCASIIWAIPNERKKTRFVRILS